MHRALLFVLFLAAPLSRAAAQDLPPMGSARTVSVAPAREAPAPLRGFGGIRPTLAFGFAFSLVGLDTYGIAANVRAGVDVLMLPSHELTVTGGWTPYTMTGARLDLFSIDAGWRFRPAPEVGFYTLITVGVALGREALDVTLGQRRFEDVLVLPGAVASIAVGWTLFDYVDLEVGYRHALLGGEDLTSLGSLVGSIGGRL